MKEGMAQNETTFFHAGTRCQMLSSLGETNEEFIFASSFSSVPPELHKLTHVFVSQFQLFKHYTLICQLIIQ
jgi:hypothetical protein